MVIENAVRKDFKGIAASCKKTILRDSSMASSRVIGLFECKHNRRAANILFSQSISGEVCIKTVCAWQFKSQLIKGKVKLGSIKMT